MNKKIFKDNDFETVWDLKNLPLTELIGSYNKNINGYDQKLLVSLDDGHVQLGNKIPADELYTKNEYAYRTLSSFKSNNGIKVFLDFCDELIKDKNFDNVVDIGGNDLSLMKNFLSRSNESYVIDPICEEDDGRSIEDINVIGKMVEDVDLTSINPDLILCRHTLEHIENPLPFFEQLLDQCDDKCTFIFEIPCFDSLMEGMRFDAVFHQHLHYFTLEDLKWLLWKVGAELVSHKYNFQGSCGGALLFAFKKANKMTKKIEKPIAEYKIRSIKSKIKLYEAQMMVLQEQIKDLPKPIFGYGAGLMLSTLGHHLKTDFKMLECILDDDPDKHGMTYKNVPVEVKFSQNIDIPKNSSFIITSLENIRPIYQRILELHPRRILLPNIC